MEEMIAQVIENLGARVTGPMSLRLYMQPLMASIFATIAGIKDAQAGRPPYLWGMLTTPENRAELIGDGWKRVGKIFIIVAVLDTVYQLIVERWVYPLEVVIVAIILAIIPYLLLRGPVNRIARLFIKPAVAPAPADGKAE